METDCIGSSRTDCAGFSEIDCIRFSEINRIRSNETDCVGSSEIDLIVSNMIDRVRIGISGDGAEGEVRYYDICRNGPIHQPRHQLDYAQEEAETEARRGAPCPSKKY